MHSGPASAFSCARLLARDVSRDHFRDVSRSVPDRQLPQRLPDIAEDSPALVPGEDGIRLDRRLKPRDGPPGFHPSRSTLIRSSRRAAPEPLQTFTA